MPDAPSERNFEEEIAEALILLDQYPPVGTEYTREGLETTYGLTNEIIQEAITEHGITAVRGLALQIDVTKTARTTASRNKDVGGAMSWRKRIDQYEEQYSDLVSDGETKPDDKPDKPTDTKKRTMSGGKAPAPVA